MRGSRLGLWLSFGIALPCSCGDPEARDREQATDEAGARRPAVIFVSIDTLSARHTSLHGYALETTPNLERWAESSVVFEHCTSNAPWTVPSYMSQFTGLYPSAFSVRAESEEESGDSWSLDASHETLAEILGGAGYRTAAFVDNPNLDPALGFAQGFELFDAQAARIPIADRSGGLRNIVPRALAWLEDLPAEAPYFLFVQALDVHGPYLPDEPWRGHFGDERGFPAGTAPVALTHADIFGAIPLYIADPVRPAGETELPLAPLVQAYDEAIRALDEDLGGFLEELEARGFLDDAVLVVSADHGESLTQHDSLFDHQTLYQQDLHVPLIVRPPGGGAGRRVSTAVQLVDLLPTLVALSGAAPPELSPHGRSLVPELHGENLPEGPVFAHADLFDARSIRVGAWKLIEWRLSGSDGRIVAFLSHPRSRAWLWERFPEFHGKIFGTAGFPASAAKGTERQWLWDEAQLPPVPSYELYDLNDDPEELRDLARDEPERVARLLEILRAESDRAESARRFGSETKVTLPPEVLEELSDLGYTSPK